MCERTMNMFLLVNVGLNEIEEGCVEIYKGKVEFYFSSTAILREIGVELELNSTKNSITIRPMVILLRICVCRILQQQK